MNEPYLTVLKDLGWCIGRGKISQPFGNGVQLEITSPSTEGDGFYSPAQTITLWREKDIEALRDLCTEIMQLKDGMKK